MTNNISVVCTRDNERQRNSHSEKVCTQRQRNSHTARSLHSGQGSSSRVNKSRKLFDSPAKNVSKCAHKMKQSSQSLEHAQILPIICNEWPISFIPSRTHGSSCLDTHLSLPGCLGDCCLCGADTQPEVTRVLISATIAS